MQSRRGGERRTEPFDPGGTEKKPLEKNNGQLGKGRGIQWRAMRGLLCEVEVVQSLVDSRHPRPRAVPPAKSPRKTRILASFHK